ncbi:sensor histidine kinase [Streptomyces varsoviensis]|uniref:sensor histidine kinase n=1 Tax=Streptomyces varsoviensis TaxID=67373 RepID=UPI000B2B9C91|nr:histidine kinase [Streptomyces varsoviensis]
MRDRVPFPRFRAQYLAVCALYAALALLWVADLSSARAGHAGAGPRAWLFPVVGPVIAGLVLLPAARPRAVTWRMAAAVVLSWLLTGFLLLPGERIVNGAWGLLETACLLVALVRVARKEGPPGMAVALSAALGLAVIVVPLRMAELNLMVAFSFLLTFCVGAAIGLGSYLRVLDGRRVRAISAVREGERRELARDLHDFVAHHVTGIVIQAQAARTIRQTAPEQVDPLLEGIERAGAETLDSMRRLVRVLREEEGEPLRPGDTLDELPSLVAEFTRNGGPPVALEVTEAARRARLGPEVETSVQRVVREALTNVRRHAPAAPSADVRIDADAERLTVQVRNAPSPERRFAPLGGRGGFGLLGLRERVEAVEGELRAEPTADGGWLVAAAFPAPGGAGPMAGSPR